MIKVLIVISLTSMVAVGCSKTNEQAESNKGGVITGACDTVDMKYAANVLPIIQANCYSCHGNGLAEGSISLDSYSKLKQQVDNGELIKVITHATGFPAMPKGLAKLSDCDINKIRSWIAHGSLNN